MKDIMIQTIDILKEKVKSNLFVIQNNQKAIRHWLKQPESEQRSKELEEKYRLSKILLTENNDFINVQLTLTSFLEKYKDVDIFDKAEFNNPMKFKNEEECFEMTVNGQLSYNTDHPYYNDNEFFQRLLLYYQKIENYEQCNELVIAKNHD